MTRCFFGSIVACLLLSFFSNAQTFSDLGTWNILTARYQLDKRWTLTGEGQIRSLSFYNQFHYYEWKGSIGYKVSDQITVLMGAGSYQTYREGGSFVEPKVNDEFRMWSQLSLNNSWQRLKIEHRYRWENRWTLRGYRNRFRYRLQAQLPLNRAKIQKNTLYAVVSDEIFLTDKATYFERNRFFAGLGYEFNSHLTVQGGWMRQFDYFVSDEIGRNFFQIAFQLSFKSKKAAYTSPNPTE